MTLLDWDRQFVIEIDAKRVVTGCPTIDGATVVLTLEDPHSVAVVELTQAELAVVIKRLGELRTGDDD